MAFRPNKIYLKALFLWLLVLETATEADDFVKGSEKDVDCEEETRCFKNLRNQDYTLLRSTGRKGIFEVNLNKKNWVIRCYGNYANWADFIFRKFTNVGPLRSLSLHQCPPLGPNFRFRIKEALGVTQIEALEITVVDGILTSDDIAGYNDFKDLSITINEKGGVDSDILKGKP